MSILNLFCKSYSKDLKRVIRLLESIRRFNVEQIPTFISVPDVEYDFFLSALANYDVTIVKDEEIISSNPRNDLEIYHKLPGSIQQQIVKAEFWRLSTCINYLCLDSDCKFIRNFRKDDFLWENDKPYTVMDEGHEFLESILNTPRQDTINDFKIGGEIYRDLFERTGKIYSFGPMPVIWSRHVWESLDINMLQPKGWSIIDAIKKYPSEIPWYGEALLKFKAIELRPCQPLFKVYHYARQYDRDRLMGLNDNKIQKIFMGVVYQSAWERSMDWPRENGNIGSIFIRRLKRILRRL